ncbi:MAG: hypothetical protein IT373_01015 [Polyangiaceae bacterium]|nr:hypothetical protein [Polyangiaceae bacterium]
MMHGSLPAPTGRPAPACAQAAARGGRFAWLLLSSFLGVAACGGTDVGNGAAAVEVDVRGYAPASQARSLTGADGWRVDELWMAVDGLRLRAGTVCDDGADVGIDVAGPFVSDLVGTGVLGGPVRFDALPGSFCELRITFHKLAAGEGAPGTPPGLTDLSVLVTGARADGAAFTVKSAMTEEFRLENGLGYFELPAGPDPLLLAFNLDPWLAALDLDSLGAGPIEVSDVVNPDRLQLFEEAVKDSAALLRDLNGDGEVDTDDVGNEIAH